MNILMSRIWTICEEHPWLFMICSMFMQTWFTLNNRALWFSDEVRYANAYQNMVQNGNWLVLSLNGIPYPDKPPIYFWFLWLIDTVTPADMPTVFFLGAAVSGLFVLFASYALAKTLGFGKTVSLAAIMLLLSNIFLAALYHYSRMDLLFCAVIITAHTCFFKAFSGRVQNNWLLAGFALAGVATLIKGPLGFIFPLLTLVSWLLWRGDIKKILSLRMLLGFSVMVAIIATWLLGVVLVEGSTYLMETVIGRHVVQRATHTFHHREPLYFYFLVLPLAWMPWTLLPMLQPFGKYFVPRGWKTLWPRHTAENDSRAFLWCMFLTTFIILSSLSGKVLIYILPMFAPLAILSAQAVFKLEKRLLERLWISIALFLYLLAAGMYLAANFVELQAPVQGLTLCSLILAGTGSILILRRTAETKSNLIILALGVIIWIYPIGLLTAPSLDASMSPKDQGRLLKSYIEQGYTPLIYRVYPGVYSYYAGRNLLELSSTDEVMKQLSANPKVALAIREKHWDSWQNRPKELTVVHRQIMAGSRYLLLIKAPTVTKDPASG